MFARTLEPPRALSGDPAASRGVPGSEKRLTQTATGARPRHFIRLAIAATALALTLAACLPGQYQRPAAGVDLLAPDGPIYTLPERDAGV